MTAYTVSQVTAYLREILEEDYDLQSLTVYGEASNVVHATSGHWYFSLKDAHAQLRCILWRSQAEELTHLPKEGASFILYGRISLYEVTGTIQLYVNALEPLGLGALYQQFLADKERLQEEGIFDSERKLPLPPYPRTIGIVTSRDAAALQDVLQVLGRRYPCANLLLSPAMVQGPAAASALQRALSLLIEDGRADLILLCRGGGSLEDLWPFNEESLARAVAASPIPIVTGVGHETDFTLVDFAADLRAPTPSAAAEIITPDSQTLRHELQKMEASLMLRLQQQLTTHANRLRALSLRKQKLSPQQRIQHHRQYVDDRQHQLALRTRQFLQMRRSKIESHRHRLAGNSPNSILNRGYAYISRPDDGSHIGSANSIQTGERLNLHFHDGQRLARAVEE